MSRCSSVAHPTSSTSVASTDAAVRDRFPRPVDRGSWSPTLAVRTIGRHVGRERQPRPGAGCGSDEQVIARWGRWWRLRRSPSPGPPGAVGTGLCCALSAGGVATTRFTDPGRPGSRVPWISSRPRRSCTTTGSSWSHQVLQAHPGGHPTAGDLETTVARRVRGERRRPRGTAGRGLGVRGLTDLDPAGGVRRVALHHTGRTMATVGDPSARRGVARGDDLGRRRRARPVRRDRHRSVDASTTVILSAPISCGRSWR